MPVIRFELLVNLLKKAIKDFGNENPMRTNKFVKMLQDTVDKYHERRGQISEKEI